MPKNYFILKIDFVSFLLNFWEKNKLKKSTTGLKLLKIYALIVYILKP